MGNAKEARPYGRSPLQSESGVQSFRRVAKRNNGISKRKSGLANKSSNPQVDENSVEQTDLIKKIISLIGDDPGREGVLDTPKRVLKSFKEIFCGYKLNPFDILSTTFEKGSYNQMVICKDIELYSTCEHHMIPFYGKAHVAYVPNTRVVGLSKLARVVDAYSRRLQIQENLTEQIASTIDEVLSPKGVMVVIEAKHMCMCARGVGKQDSLMVTSAIRGVFAKDSARQEFLNLIKG